MTGEKVKNGFTIAAWTGGIIFIIGTIFASGSNYQRLNNVEENVNDLKDIKAKVEVLNNLLPRLEKQINDLQIDLNKREKY
ncbi:MAG: hypothetical protein WC879_17320 [Melioribacteraceae bacterium]